MICTIHQPQYLPWLGYFDKIRQADIFVVLDDVQYKKNEFQNRNKIKTANGWQWLTVPVVHKFGDKLNEVKPNNNLNWRKQHYQTLVCNYSKAAYFQNYEPFLQEVFEKQWEDLVEINIFFIKYLLKVLNISTKLLRSSDLKTEFSKTERLVEICQKLGADTYLAGSGGKDYMELELFDKANIELIFQEYKHPIYNQLYGDFIPYMSIIDLLFNHGDKSIDILKGEKA